MKTLIAIFILVIPALSQVNDPFWRMYETSSIAEKKEIFFTLTEDEQNEARRMNIAWAAGQLNPSSEQIAFLHRYVSALSGMTPKLRDAMRDEAIELFPKGGDLYFGTMGPYKPCSVFIRRSISTFQPSNCPCSVGSSFNMSCDGECTAAGTRCTTTSGGCGFGWMYSCNGFCQQS